MKFTVIERARQRNRSFIWGACGREELKNQKFYRWIAFILSSNDISGLMRFDHKSTKPFLDIVFLTRYMLCLRFTNRQKNECKFTLLKLNVKRDLIAYFIFYTLNLKFDWYCAVFTPCSAFRRIKPNEDICHFLNTPNKLPISLWLHAIW